MHIANHSGRPSHHFQLGGIPLKTVVATIWDEIRADDVLGRAAQLAYYFFLALFPFLIFLVSALSVFGSADRGRALLFQIIARFLPGLALQLIKNTFEAILRAGGPLKMSFGAIFSLWSASMGMMALMDTLNAAYRVRETRSFVKQYAVAIGLTLAIASMLIVSLLAVVLGNSMARALSAREIFAVAWRYAQWPLGLALMLLALAVAYHFAPNVKQRTWHWVTPGTVLSALLLISVSLVLRVYLHFAGASTRQYGPLGAVIVLLLCFYMIGFVVLVGGVLNAVIENAIPGRQLPPRDAQGLRGMQSNQGQQAVGHQAATEINSPPPDSA